MEDKIKLILKDEKKVEITKKAAELSELLKNAINEHPNEDTFTLNEIDENTGKIIREYLLHFNGVAPPEIEKPLTSNEMENLTDKWSADFINNIPFEELVNLTVSASHMGINCLSDLCCAKIASMCKDKTDEEIFKTFNINETFTEEEKAKIKEENKWIEENI